MQFFKKKSDKALNQGLDSFYESRIIVHINDEALVTKVMNVLLDEGFDKAFRIDAADDFFSKIFEIKYDLIIFDLNTIFEEDTGYRLVERIRLNNPDVAIITISEGEPDVKHQLELNIDRHFAKPFLIANLVKAAKRALGNKYNYEIGMQFFDALFGMQMCTHRDLHQRTFDHVIRTTKIYGKFLLYLNKHGILNLTSWSLKNCLMASLVHDIGKLLVMHGVLYKEGKLSDFEYAQIKRHSWHSITALLGGQDVDFFAKSGPIQTVSGYNDKNLGAQVQRWIFKVMHDDSSAFDDVDSYFTEMSETPFIHALNKDLLCIVFRHHDGLNSSYHTEEELHAFSKIIGYEINLELTADSPLDVVTNALSLCDMYDALLDTKRDYRRTPFIQIFALFLLYSEMKQGKFFEFLLKHFVNFIIENKYMSEENPFSKLSDGNQAYFAIQNIHQLFRVTKDQEPDFNDFIMEYRDQFENYAINLDNKGLGELNTHWLDYFTARHKSRIDLFIKELKAVDLFSGEVASLKIEQIKTFDMLLRFYYSYSSPSKQKKLIEYLVDSVVNPKIDRLTKERIAKLVSSGDYTSRKELERLLMEKGFDRIDLFEVFQTYDENTLINELNDFLRRSGH